MLHQPFSAADTIGSPGAGCSTGAGIPDFRSSTGLFKALKDKHPRAGLTSGKDLFNASLFQVREIKSLPGHPFMPIHQEPAD